MDSEELLACLQKCDNTDKKISILSTFVDSHREYSALSTDDSHSVIAGLIGTVSFLSRKHYELSVDDKTYEKSCRYARLVCKVLSAYTSVYKDSPTDERRVIFAKLAPFYIILCAQLQRHINTYCDVKTERHGSAVLTAILEVGSFENLKKALDDPDLHLFKITLKLVLPTLTRDKWKESSSGMPAFVFLLTNTGGDVLTENLDSILPFTLILTDDFVPHYARLGIECINHIFNEIPSAELRLRGRAEVLYDAISRKLYTKEPQIAKAVIPCILQSLQCLETEMMRKRGCRIPKHDECFENVLNNLHLSNDIIVKTLYAKSLPLFISRMGIQCIGHITTVLVVLEYGFDTSNLEIVRHLAIAVTEFVNCAWPRLLHHCEKLLKILVKTLYSIENDVWRTHSETYDAKTEATDSIIAAIAKLGMVSEDLVLETADMLAKEESLGLKSHALKMQQLTHQPS